MRQRRTDRQVDREALRSLVESLPFRQTPRSWLLSCPRCGKKKLYIQKSNGRSRCMRCGPDFQGWADYVLSHVLGRSRDELERVLYDGVPAGTLAIEDLDLIDPWGEWGNEDEIELDTEDPLPPPIIWDPDTVDLDKPAGARGLAYLERRGITLDMAQRHGIRFNPRESRVCFPVEVNGMLRGWQGRYIGSTEVTNEEGHVFSIPKVMTTGEVGGKTLMFGDRLKGAVAGIMVEGPVDAVKCDLVYRKTSGRVAATATMGKSFTEQQVQLYLRSGIRRLYVGLDDDADEDIMRAARVFSPHLEVFRLATPPGRDDLGDATPEEVFRQFRYAERLEPTHLYIHLNMDDPRWS